jgi:hypothetical protein
LRAAKILMKRAEKSSTRRPSLTSIAPMACRWQREPRRLPAVAQDARRKTITIAVAVAAVRVVEAVPEAIKAIHSK